MTYSRHSHEGVIPVGNVIWSNFTLLLGTRRSAGVTVWGSKRRCVASVSPPVPIAERLQHRSAG